MTKPIRVIRQLPVKPERAMTSKDFDVNSHHTLQDIVDFFQGIDLKKVTPYCNYDGVEGFMFEHPESDETYQKKLDEYEANLKIYQEWLAGEEPRIKRQRKAERKKKIDALQLLQKETMDKLKVLLDEQKDDQ